MPLFEKYAKFPSSLQENERRDAFFQIFFGLFQEFGALENSLKSSFFYYLASHFAKAMKKPDEMIAALHRTAKIFLAFDCDYLAGEIFLHLFILKPTPTTTEKLGEAAEIFLQNS
jgi:hypothetical protein